MAMSIITSRCGSVSLMGLGLTLVGLVMAGAVTGVGQLWLTHQELQDALNNAAAAMEASHNTQLATMATLIKQDGGFSSVTIVSFTANTGAVAATASTPAKPWFWPTWMGPTPIRVVAAT